MLDAGYTQRHDGFVRSEDLGLVGAESTKHPQRAKYATQPHEWNQP